MRIGALLASSLFAVALVQPALAQAPHPAAAQPAAPPALAPLFCTIASAHTCTGATCTKTDNFGDLKLPVKVLVHFDSRVIASTNAEGFPHISQIASFAKTGNDYVLQGVEPAPEKAPYSRILKMRSTWAFTVAYAITSPVFWFYLYWLPPFLNQQYNLGISVTQMGLPLMVIYLTADFGSVFGGALSSYMISRGMAPVRSRLLSMLLFALCISSIVFAAGASSMWMAVLFISLAVGAHQAWTANIWSVVMDTTPKHVVSSVFGFGGMISAIGGMFMTQLVGYVLTKTHNNYAVLFTMIPVVYFAALAWLYFMAPRKVEGAA